MDRRLMHPRLTMLHHKRANGGLTPGETAEMLCLQNNEPAVSLATFLWDLGKTLVETVHQGKGAEEQMAEFERRER